MFKETQYKSLFKLNRPRERAFKQFKYPVLNMLRSKHVGVLLSIFMCFNIEINILD